MAQTSSLFLKMRVSDRLGRYYTKNDIASLLIDQMDDLSPRRVLDLGAGAGSLSRAALERWSDVELLTVDVDAAAQVHLNRLFSTTGSSKHNHIRADALSNRLPALISAKAGFIDAAVCNPPFIVPKWRKNFAQIIEDAGFSGCLSVLADVDAALLFLAQNLRLLSANATLGIILPDSLVSASKYRLFRKELLQRYIVRKVIRLPRRSFVNTDAQAYIIVISKGGSTTQKIPLLKFGTSCEINPEVLVSVDDAVDRLDYEYHAQQLDRHHPQSIYEPLGAFAVELKRGTLSSAEARLVRFPVFHTTDMTLSFTGAWCDLTGFGREPIQRGLERPIVRAEPGDILVARVGRNLEQKVLGVSSGYPALTDCVYKLRVQKQHQDKVLAQLSSTQGQEWLASRAYGVSARQLTKTGLLAFPIAR